MVFYCIESPSFHIDLTSQRKTILLRTRLCQAISRTCLKRQDSHLGRQLLNELHLYCDQGDSSVFFLEGIFSEIDG